MKRFQVCGTPYAEKAWEVYDSSTGETVATCNTREMAKAIALRRNRKEGSR
jgi:hypothetical protein